MIISYPKRAEKGDKYQNQFNKFIFHLFQRYFGIVSLVHCLDLMSKRWSSIAISETSFRAYGNAKSHDVEMRVKSNSTIIVNNRVHALITSRLSAPVGDCSTHWGKCQLFKNFPG